MKIQNKYTKLFLEVLMNTKLPFKEARLRDDFGEEVAKAYKKFEDNRIKLCVSLCEKDKDKKPKTETYTDEDGTSKERYVFGKNAEKFNKELVILQDEIANIPLKSGDAKKIVSFMEKTEYIPQVGEAKIIDKEIISKVI